MEDSAHREREHFFGAAKLVAGLTILSRILGLVRDMADNAFSQRKWLVLDFLVPGLLLLVALSAQLY